MQETYRKAIDDYYKDPKIYEANKPQYMAEIKKGVNRQLPPLFLWNAKARGSDLQIIILTRKLITYLGTITGKERDLMNWSRRTKFCVGDTVEVIKP